MLGREPMREQVCGADRMANLKAVAEEPVSQSGAGMAVAGGARGPITARLYPLGFKKRAGVLSGYERWICEWMCEAVDICDGFCRERECMLMYLDENGGGEGEGE